MPTAGLYIGELLLRERLVDEEALAQGLHAQSLYGGRLGTNLVELGVLSIADLGRQLAQQHGVPEATPQEFLAADARLLERITPEMCVKYRVLPLRVMAGKLHVAMIDPADLVQLDELAFTAGMKIQPHAVPELRMYYFLEQRCGVPREERYRRLTDDGLGVVTSEINLSFAPVKDESVPSVEVPSRWENEPPRAPRVPTGPLPHIEEPSSRSRRRCSDEIPHLAQRPTRSSAESPRVGSPTLSFDQRASREDDSQPTQTARQSARGTPPSPSKPTTGARRLAPQDLATGPLPSWDPTRAPATAPPRAPNATIEGSDDDQDLVYLDAVPRTSTSPSNVAVSAPPPAAAPRPTTTPGRAPAPSRAPRPITSTGARAAPVQSPRTPRPITSPSARVSTPVGPPSRTPRPITSPAARIPSPSSSMPPLTPQPALVSSQPASAPSRPPDAVRSARAELPDLPMIPATAEDASEPLPLVSLEAVFSGLDQAVEGSAVGRLLVLGASAHASLSVLFHLQGEMLSALHAIGSPLTVEQVQQLTLPLGSSFLLRQASSLGEPVWGTVARDPLQQVVSGYLRAPQPDQICVLPISLGGRVAQLLCVQFPVGEHLTKVIYDELIRLADKGSTTYARLAAAR
jgi:hypothetical protein